MSPPNISAFIEEFHIDAVSSPFGAGDRDIREGLTTALAGQAGRDLIGKPIPKGLTVLAVIVDPPGGINIYLEPVCATSSIVRPDIHRDARVTLANLQQVRDQELMERPHGRELVDIHDDFGPIFDGALQSQPDGDDLRRALGEFVIQTFREPEAARTLAPRLDPVGERMSRLRGLLSQRSDSDALDKLVERSIRFVREEVREGRDFNAIIGFLTGVLDEEAEELSRAQSSHHVGA